MFKHVRYKNMYMKKHGMMQHGVCDSPVNWSETLTQWPQTCRSLLLLSPELNWVCVWMRESEREINDQRTFSPLWVSSSLSAESSPTICSGLICSEKQKMQTVSDCTHDKKRPHSFPCLEFHLMDETHKKSIYILHRRTLRFFIVSPWFFTTLNVAENKVPV